MRRHTVNYLQQDREEGRSASGWRLVNLGFFFSSVPRPVLLCRMLGHKPVVDGVVSTARSTSGYRNLWVCCDRCGERPKPQGSLDPVYWEIGDRYCPRRRLVTRGSRLRLVTGGVNEMGYVRPGPFTARPVCELGGQVIVGPVGAGVGWEFKVGHRGSEHTLALALHFGFLGCLYLHTSRLGMWLQRRLNPHDLQSRVTGIRWVSKRLEWKFWHPRDESTYPSTWRAGSVGTSPMDALCGPKHYTHTDQPGGITSRVVKMPEGDYLVELNLQRQSLGRRRGRKKLSWHVNWDSVGVGIPTDGRDRGKICGSGVKVSERSVRAGTWAAEAVAAIASDITASRTRRGWEPVALCPVEPVTA